jgi:UDP-glucose:glycoprotein glucosyltransferase
VLHTLSNGHGVERDLWPIQNLSNMARNGRAHLLAAALSLLSGSLLTAATPPVKVSLRSSWPAPPFLVELIESVTLESPNAFFPLLDALTSPETVPSLKSMTPEAIRQSGLQIATSRGFLSEPGALAAVDMNLALHAATPRIEASYGYYVDRLGTQRQLAAQKEECGSWVDWYGEIVCDLETLARLAGLETLESGDQSGQTSSVQRPKLLTFDHIYPPPSQTLEPPPRTAIFYASLDSPNFWALHSYLLSLADRPIPHVEYVLRHIPPLTHRHTTRSYLSGYGVILDLKKMEYLALDDRNSGVRGQKPEDIERDSENSTLDPIAALLETYPVNITAPDANSPLTSDELLEIGLKSTQLISDSREPLRTLTQLAQNFPKYATSVARRVVASDQLEAEVQQNQFKVQGGISMAWLNGASVTENDMNPFSLLRLFRKERNIISSLTALGVSREEALKLLTHPAIGASQSNSVLDGVFDASDRLEGGGVITWWNDMEKDKRYSSWSSSILPLMRSPSNGQFHTIKRNLFNIILVLDLSQTANIHFIAGPVANIIERTFPFRWGIVPVVETLDSARMARLFKYLVQNYGRAKTMGFIKSIAQLRIPIQMQDPGVDWSFVRSQFEALVSAGPPKDPTATTDFDTITNNASDDSKTRAYCQRLSSDLTSSPQGHAFFNGKHFDMDDDFLRSMQMEVGKQLRYLQEKLYENELSETDSENISTYFYDLPSSAKRRNQYIYPTSATGSLRIVNAPEIFSRVGLRTSSSTFIYPAESPVVPLSMYVVADLDSEAGLGLIKEALSSMEPGSLTRISFIHNPAQPQVDTAGERPRTSWLISHLFSTGALSKASPNRLLKALGVEAPAIPGNNPQTVLSNENIFDELTGGVALSEFNPSAYAQFVKSSRLLARELQIVPGKQALFVNGRIIGPFEEGAFAALDFKALQDYEYNKRAKPVIDALEAVQTSNQDFDRASFAHLISMLSSVVSSIQLPDPSESGLFDTPPRPRNRNYLMLDGEHSSFESGDNSTAIYHLALLLDPLGEMAQKWPSLLEWLSHIPDVYVKVYLNPARYNEVPLKRFYRYNLLPFLSFDEDGQEIPAQAVFEELPIEPIYTLAMEVPPSWLVRPKEALYDLDNIQLSHLSPKDAIRGVEAVFDLDYLVVEGHARDTRSGTPPRGLQLQLTTSDSSPVGDTQVVANLGYLQFKAKPGVFQLEIREGIGREIYTMESVGNEGWDSPTVEEVGNEITLTSFEGLTLYPRLARVPGMEMAEVLADPSLQEDARSEGSFVDGVFSKVASFFKPKEAKTDLVVKKSSQADINIFTVASGLLYERFVSIMILSVLRNTNSTVKFWFIENFLSPSFLEFIPHLAEAYNFDYELVTYKWPSWLRAQKEKQRIIWAYKILFLDVLFPMDLKKVIFVDADQIVRADLKELVDLDLHGAPYGYTPMGDDNTDMEGFRFWKTGYWKDFLQGRPYHISALYVVDLVRFRQIAAGDMLRGQYQQLSQDPNSLANLDQDLPNNLQREVPIFSLPEDWLWCETWCSKDRLHRAKTIDLCQNPLTKEPKLSRARQIPEWEEYDSEISQFARKLAEKGLIQSGMAAADANVLANAGTSLPSEQASGELDSSLSEEEQEHRRDEL